MAAEPSSQIVLQAKLEQLPVLERWVEALAVQFLVPPSMVHRIDLCLTELVTNLIDYGYSDDVVGTVSVYCWRQSEQIVIRIDDDGIAFDPTAYVPPDLPSSLAEASAGGRGIRLVRHFADGLQHVRKVDGNQLTLVFRSPPQGVMRQRQRQSESRSI